MRSDDRLSATETACWQQQMKDGPPSSHPTPEVDELQCMSLTRSHERTVVAARPSRVVSRSRRQLLSSPVEISQLWRRV